MMTKLELKKDLTTKDSIYKHKRYTYVDLYLKQID